MSRWSWVFKQLRRHIGFRAALISLGGILLALLSGLAGRLIPFDFAIEIGQNAVGTILQILASSMLAVTTFSLTAMVTAYGSATQLATPRATQLMREDPTSQNALSTFLGAFVFAIVGIIGLQTNLYGNQGRIVLFAGTLAMVAAVVLTLLRWIAHITAFGRMSDVIDRVEDAAARSMEDFARAPFRGGRPAVAVPANAQPLYGKEVGYVIHADVPALGRLASENNLTIHLAAIPGTLVHPSRPLLHWTGSADEDAVEAMAEAFTFGRHRAFDQDPRLGLIVLSEVASRALAPATNDPGTAIEVMNSLLRVFLKLARAEPNEVEDGETPPGRPPVHVAMPSMAEMIGDAFDPIIREGVAEVEVSLRLSKVLAAIHDGLPEARAATAAYARRLAESVERRQEDPHARDLFTTTHEALWKARTA
ncbi:MAG: DUF2254 domain-containing protein [Methylobacterium mesophilicum]|nr:DUF2254 domain-containing protein [Methylobacterium mesophilicum]